MGGYKLAYNFKNLRRGSIKDLKSTFMGKSLSKGDTPKFCSYIGSDPASAPYPKNIWSEGI